MILEHFPVGPLQCNCIIVGDERTKQAVVIDPGDELERITDCLRRHDLHVASIVATHAHIDHVGALAELKRSTGSAVLMHEADIPLYRQLAQQATWLGVPSPPIGEVDDQLVDGGRIEFGAKTLEVSHTPGHSPGSVCLTLAQDRPILFAGDTLFAGSIGRTDLWGGSLEQILKSIRFKLLTLPDDVLVIPGHGPQTTIGAERRTNPFLTL